MTKDIRAFLRKTQTSLTNLLKELDSTGPVQAMPEKTIQAYVKHCRKVFSELPSANLAEALEKALKANWDLIKGSLLSYTALPYHPVTKIWTKAAQLVALSKPVSSKPANPLLYLIPDLQCVESIHFSFPDLEPVYNASTGQWEMDLLKILSTHIQNDAGTHLIPVGSIFILGEEGGAGFPPIFNPYVNDDTERSLDRLNEKETLRLFHYSLDTQIIYESKQQYDAMAVNNNDLLGKLTFLRQKMKENSANGRGSELVAGDFFDKHLMDFIAWYNAIEDHSDEPYQIKQFIQTLRDFSAPVLNPFNKVLITKTLQRVAELPSEDNQFFKEYFEPLKMIEAMDNPNQQQLEEAREIIYKLLSQLGIITSLTHKPLERAIPQALVDKASKLKRYAFRKDNRENPATCLNILGSKLDKLLVTYRDVLANIRTSANRQESLTEEAIKIYRSAKETFKKKLDTKEPLNGHDKLPLTHHVLKKLQVRISFNRPQDLEVLENLSPDEITEIFRNPLLVDALLHQNNRDQLILFVLTASTEKLFALLTSLSQSLLKSSKKHWGHLIPLIVHLTEALEVEQCQTIYDPLKHYLARLCIDKTSQFERNLIDQISSAKQGVLWGSIIDELLRLTTTAESFCKVYGILSLSNNEKMKFFFNQMRERLPALMRTVTSRTLVFEKLSDNHRQIIFPNGLADQSDNIRTLNQFMSVYDHLHFHQQVNLFKHHKNTIPGWINSSIHLLQLFRILNPAEFDELILEIQIDKLPKKATVSEVRSALEGKYEGRIPGRYIDLLITLTDLSAVSSFRDLKNLIEPMHLMQIRSDEQDRQFLMKTQQHIRNVFNSIEPRLDTFSCYSTYDMAQVLKAVNIEQRNVIFDRKLLPNLNTLIQNTNDWNNLLFYISPEQRNIVNRYVFNNLPWQQLFTKLDDFIRAPFPVLESEQIGDILSSCKEVLQRNIKSFGSLTTFLRKLRCPKEDNKLVFDMFKGRFKSWVGKSADTISTLLSCLAPSENKEAFELLKNIIPKHIKSARDLVSIGRYLTKQQLSRIRSRIKFETNEHSLLVTLAELNRLDVDERAATLASIFDFLPRLIYSLQDLSDLREYLSAGQYCELFLMCFDKLTAVQNSNGINRRTPALSSASDYLQLLQSLKFEQACAIYSLIVSKLPEHFARHIFLLQLETFNESPEKFIGFCNNAHFQLSTWIRSIPDLIFFMEKGIFLNTELLLKAARPILQAINPSASDIEKLKQHLSEFEFKEVIACFPEKPADEENRMQTDSPGRNRNAFFGLKRKNDAVCPTTNKRPRLEDKEHNLEKESESTISSDLLNFEMDEALDDWLLGETTTEGTIELETGFVM